MLVVVGLGNPGSQYANNRHNIGFNVVQALADKLQAPPFRSKFNGRISRIQDARLDLMLVQPMTYMNRSGDCIAPLLHFYRIEPADMLVIHDELDLPFSALRIKQGGGHAGHNGLRSIMQHLGDDPFLRLRVGIGKPPPLFAGQTADFVLSDFNAEQREQLPELIDRAVSAVRIVMRFGAQEAMNRLNVRPRKPKGPKHQTTVSAQQIATQKSSAIAQQAVHPCAQIPTKSHPVMRPDNSPLCTPCDPASDPRSNMPESF